MTHHVHNTSTIQQPKARKPERVALRMAIIAAGTIGLAEASLAVGSAAGQATPRTSERARQVDAEKRLETHRDGAMRSDADAKRTLDAMRRSGMTLAKAIAVAERQLNGQAIEARCSSGSADGTATVDVTVLDESGRASVAVVSLGDGKVLTTRPMGMMGEPGTKSMASGMILKASNCDDRSVLDSGGKVVGEIDELIIDEPRGRIAYAIVEVKEGNNHLVAVPWSALRHDEKTCHLDLPDVTLNRAPTYDAAKWSTANTEGFARPIADYYHTPLYGNDMPLPEGQPLSFIKLSDVIGMDIHGASGEKLGDIEDLVIDPSSGRISYAALSFGGFLGFNDKLFAVPWDALKARKDGSVVLAVDKARLNDAPGFDKAHWPTTANERFEEDVREFYKKRTAGATE